MTLRIFNTATRTLEEFAPQNPPTVTMYNCGPTVYNYAHIGNLRAYVFADILRRALEMNGYGVNQVINITDVGHLVSDADEGEDKIIVGALREGKSIEEIITTYSDAFYDDLAALNILAAKDRGMENHFPRATYHIKEQVALINKLDEEGYTYSTSDGIYFDTNKFPRYPNFAKLDIEGLQSGTRVAMGEKRNTTDFALWKFSPLESETRLQEWDSPLGIVRKGFPGWHVECSAMAMKYLGETIDIHTGGIDHIPVHHTNEIAQSECATGKPFARYWMHSAFMNVDGQKMSKSLGNTYRLVDLAERGISSMAYRYWLLTAKYDTQLNFTWEALNGAQIAYDKLRQKIYELKNSSPSSNAPSPIEGLELVILDDLDTPSAIARMWKIIQDKSFNPNTVVERVISLDRFLGLKLTEFTPSEIKITPEIQILVNDRQQARDAKNFTESDRLRDEISKLGYEVKDTPDGQRLFPL